ncbi:hypothetical protein BDZ89DRAFT_1082008 [Hymenopellis radicata]|nr:hypothetical protein BDZ89DRAFT_1082008 [Hymenopellis radicata]
MSKTEKLTVRAQKTGPNPVVQQSVRRPSTPISRRWSSRRLVPVGILEHSVELAAIP